MKVASRGAGVGDQAGPGAGAETVLVSLPTALACLMALPRSGGDARLVLRQAVVVCCETLGPAYAASMALGPPQDPQMVVSTSQFAQTVDGAQMFAAQGPCMDAFASRSAVSSDDVAADPRWPLLAEHLPPSRFAASAVPVEVGGRLAGCLNVYAVGAGIPRQHRETVQVLGAGLGAVLRELQLNDELRRLGEDMRRALSSRAVIEQAKGIIMAERRCTAEEAFAHLVHLSSNEQRKLRDVARSLVDQLGVGRSADSNRQHRTVQ